MSWRLFTGIVWCKVIENIALQYKLFKKLKLSKFNVDMEIYNKARHRSYRLILQKKGSTSN